tara:strand:+ start:2605 stop:2907 length:303 start_codon:yes stop_codon:yes gene_type:complete
MKKQNLKNYIDQATKNITDDRAATQSLLVNLMKFIQGSDDRHRELGLVAAKYLETLQRSNEQLVKLAALLQKGESKDNEITESDKEEIFNLIKEQENVEV